MTSPSDQNVDFGSTLRKLPCAQVWEYQSGTQRTCQDAAAETFAALQSPQDFPPLQAAIVPGDRVAIAVDANVPSIAQVVQGAIRALEHSAAGEIEVVVSDEASDATLQAIARIAGDAIPVTRHQCSKREGLRYLGADEEADPIYLNRWLVDADFVLPIAAGHALDTAYDIDLTGLFPAFADSRARRRFLSHHADGTRSKEETGTGNSAQPAWLLGLQIMISVTANHLGLASEVLAGTPEAIGKQRAPARRVPDEFPPSAPLVIASLDGDAQQQSWANAARAVSAAARYAMPGGTIALWSEIAASPSTAAIDSLSDADDSESTSGSVEDAEQEFPPWIADEISLQTLARVAEEHRLLIRSQIEREVVESMGFAAIESADELIKLSQSFDSCGILRAAQFAGTTTFVNGL